jgi:hypothetical protein
MPSIDNVFLKLLKDDYTQYNCFIETGTLNGDTTFALEPHFNKFINKSFIGRNFKKFKFASKNFEHNIKLVVSLHCIKLSTLKF